MSRGVIVVVLMLLAVPAGFAADARFGDCPDDSPQSQWDCDETLDGAPFPPTAVTAHTVYASFVMDNVMNNTLGLPTDFAAVAGYFAVVQNETTAWQRECVVWFNGYNLDQRPDPDGFGWGGANKFPSDEDEPAPPPGGQDESYQDYDFDRDVEGCVPMVELPGTTDFANFIGVVEKGDCDPRDGQDWVFRGHIDFVDPNNIYHEVQEYDYACGGLLAMSGPRNVIPASIGLGAPTVADVVADMFPSTGTDIYNEDGCQVYETPADNQDVLGTQDPGHFDLGHKCNGSVRDLFTERMWLTRVHAVVTDPTILQPYNFAVQIDTCAGINIYDVPGKSAMGASNGYEDAAVFPDPVTTPFVNPNEYAVFHDAAYHTYYGQGIDAYLGGWPLYDLCTDGSSFSFDDTPRGRVVHAGPPSGTGSTAIMRGNSYDYDTASDTFGKHRTNCRNNGIDWPMNTFPPGPPAVADDCYAEDHKTAEIDIYAFDNDPTGGLWAVNTHGLNGMNAYVGPGLSTGPNDSL